MMPSNDTDPTPKGSISAPTKKTQPGFWATAWSGFMSALYAVGRAIGHVLSSLRHLFAPPKEALFPEPEPEQPSP